MHILFMRKHPLAILVVFAPAIVGLLVAALTQLTVVALLGVIATAFAAWKMSGGGREGWRELGLNLPVGWRRTLLFGLGGALAVHLVVATVLPVLARVLGPPDLSAFASIQGRADRLIFMLIIALVNGAFAEEIVFRGFLLGRLERHLAPRVQSALVPLVLTSMLFGLAHMYQGWSGVIGTALAGLVFGVVRLLDGKRLWGAVAAHGIYDWSALFIVYLVGIPGSSG